MKQRNAGLHHFTGNAEPRVMDRGGNHLPPLNGSKTHPLSDAGRKVLLLLLRGPLPCQEINPGVVNRLLRESLVEIVELPSPYKTHKGKGIAFARITESGRGCIS